MRKGLTPFLILALILFSSIAFAQSAQPQRPASRFDSIVGPTDTSDNGYVLKVNPPGSILVQCLSADSTVIEGCGGNNTINGGGVDQADRSAFVDGTTHVNTIGGCYNETNTNPSEDQAACPRITLKRAWHVNLRDAAGNELGLVTTPLFVQGTVALGAGSAVIGHVIVDSGGGGGTTAAGSTTAGTTGNINLCATTTVAPTNTTGQNNFLSCNTSGGLRVDGSGVTQPVSGTITANAGTGNFTVTQGTGTNLHTVVDSGTITSLTQMNGQAIAMGTGARSAGTQRVTIATDDIVPASQSGTWNITNVSGTISLPTGAATSANQTTANTSLSSIATNTTGLVTDAHFQALALAAGSTTSGSLGHLGVCAVTTSPPSYTTAQNNFLSCDGNGNLRVNIARLDASLDKVSIGSAVSGGSTPFKLIAAATTNATNVKASPGQIYHMQLVNLSGSIRYVKLYNTASAPTCNSSTVIKTIPVFASAAALLDYEEGLEFLTGISFCVTGGLVDNDNTAIAANDMTINIDYK